MISKYYLNAGKAPDLKSPRERIIYRCLEILPGFLSWTTLVLVLVFSHLKPVWVAVFIIIFDFYWFLRAIHFSIHLIFTYRKMKKNLQTDWMGKLKKLKAPDIYHLIIFPMYKEPYEVVKGSFNALLKSDYPKDKMIVVLATEERAGKYAQEISEKIKKEFGDKFLRFLVTVHPKDIIGEIAGKGSNETWAGKKAKKVIDELKIPYENIIVSCFDIDTQVGEKYFSCLTYYYLTSRKPTRTSFQPIPLYNNNIWQVPLFSRLVATCNVFWQMFQQSRPEKLITYSSHSMSFKALVEMGFWQTNVVSEDAGVFLKAFLFYNGDYYIVPLFYPISMDACVDKTFFKTVISQYRQQRRWAWGVEGIPYLLFGFLKDTILKIKSRTGNKHKKLKFMSWRKKFRYTILLLGGFYSWAVAALIILTGGWLPVILGGKEFNVTLLSYNLPRLTGQIMTLAVIGVFVCAVIGSLLLPPRPKNSSRIKAIFVVLQWIFLPVTMIVFGAIPALEAQTRLMFGKYMGFWVTPKVRK